LSINDDDQASAAEASTKQRRVIRKRAVTKTKVESTITNIEEKKHVDKKIKSKDSAVISMQSFFKKNLELIDYAIKGKASPTEILASTNNGNDPVQQYSMQTLSPGT
jgi:hypothetical protein